MTAIVRDVAGHAEQSSLARAAAVRHAHRAAGQTRALSAMILSGRPFDEIAQQVLAARGSLDALLVRVLEIELDGCLGAAERVEVAALVNVALGRRPGSGAPVRAARSDPSHAMRAGADARL